MKLRAKKELVKEMKGALETLLEMRGANRSMINERLK
jgi:hypothetical protein